MSEDNHPPQTTEIDPNKFLIDEATMISSTFMFNVSPTFPFTITFADGGATVTLLADGTWEGDIVAVKQGVKDMKGVQGTGGVLMWLVLREMLRDDRRFW